MIQYIYFVKCPNCEDEAFDFFDDAKSFATGCLSKQPIITQVEVDRNDFGECVDSCDLGTIWSWKDCMADDEPACSTFTKDYCSGNYDPDCDPEFTALDDTLDAVPDNFRRPSCMTESVLTEDDEYVDPEYERRKSQAQRGYDPHEQPSAASTYARSGDLENRDRRPSGYNSHEAPSKASMAARDNDLENRDAITPDTKTISKILVKWASLMDYNTFEKLNGSASKVLKASNPWWLKSPGDEAGYACCVTKDGKVKDESVASKQGFRPMIEIIPADFKDDKLYEPVKAMRGDWIKISDKYLLWKDPTDLVAFDAANTLYNDFDKANIKKVLDAWCEKYFKGVGAVFGSGSAEYTKEVNKELSKDASKRESIGKPIPEGMTIEQLVEEMEENEDTVECTWCEDLFDKSECRYEVNLGWLCSRCEAAIKSRGETLTFRENNYWDFLDEDTAEPETSDAKLKEAVTNKDNDVVFDYSDKKVTLTGNYYPGGYYSNGDPREPDWDEEEFTVDISYPVDRNTVEEALIELMGDGKIEEPLPEDLRKAFEGEVDIPWREEVVLWDKYFAENFDMLVDKYYGLLKNHFLDAAIEYYEENNSIESEAEKHEPEFNWGY